MSTKPRRLRRERLRFDSRKAATRFAEEWRAITLYSCDRCNVGQGWQCVSAKTLHEVPPHMDRVNRAARFVKPMDIAVAHALLTIAHLYNGGSK